MAEPFVLSASSLNTYLRCGKQWEFAYVLGSKAPPSLRAVRGIAVHAAVETNMRQKITTEQDLPLADVVDAYSDSYDLETRDGYMAKGDETHGSVKDVGVKLTKLYQKVAAPRIQPYTVEEPISFTVNGQVWTGQIDLTERVPKNLWGEPEYGIVVRDTKTSGQQPKPEQYAINMTGYSVGVQQMTGEQPVDVVFDYLIATKQPKYHEIRTGPVSEQRVRAFAGLVDDVASSINKGSFPATGLTNPGVCDWCGYQAQCPAYKIKNPNA